MVRSILGVLLAALCVRGADWSGIWSGRVAGKNSGEDIAFQIRVKDGQLSGRLFGDEFDLPMEQVSAEGDTLRFVVTTMNYYSRKATKFRYTGAWNNGGIEMTRERIVEAGDAGRQTFSLRRVTKPR
jgi:hypothetical protein